MSDGKERAAERRAAAGEGPGAAARAGALRCRREGHAWDLLGLFSPGRADMSGGHAGPGQLRVEACWRCRQVRALEGTPLCYWCGRPAELPLGDDEPKGLVPEPAAPGEEGEHLAHPACLARVEAMDELRQARHAHLPEGCTPACPWAEEGRACGRIQVDGLDPSEVACLQPGPPPPACGWRAPNGRLCVLGMGHPGPHETVEVLGAQG